MSNKLQLYKESVLKEFEDKYCNFEFCDTIAKPDLEKYKLLISNILDYQLQLIRENIPEEKFTDITIYDDYDFSEKHNNVGFNDCRTQLLAFLETEI